MLAQGDLPFTTEVLDLLCKKLLEDEGRIGVGFPYVTHPDGSWDTMLASRSAGYDGVAWSHGNWFCGFWVGLLAAAYLHSGNSRFLELARERMLLVAPRVSDPNTHDIGFIFWSSAIPLFRLTKERVFKDIGLQAAIQLRARLVTTASGAYISSWGPLDDPRGRASSAIDTMANIPLLYWAAQESGDASFRLAGEAHAAMTERAFIREDYTLYHAVEYDAVSGHRIRGYTFQGYADESSWSRGAGWAVLGYAATARATGHRRWLDLAVRLAEGWLGELGSRRCPPWDFSDPSADPTEDSAAGAIMAAALLDIGALHPDARERERWTARGTVLLTSLANSYLARGDAHRGMLMHGCYSKPQNIGTDAAVMFGDYYFVEAIARLALPGRLVENPATMEARARL
jgi:unsaturated chondroitin disaccharide hydrolase